VESAEGPTGLGGTKRCEATLRAAREAGEGRALSRGTLKALGSPDPGRRTAGRRQEAVQQQQLYTFAALQVKPVFGWRICWYLDLRLDLCFVLPKYELLGRSNEGDMTILVSGTFEPKLGLCARQPAPGWTTSMPCEFTLIFSYVKAPSCPPQPPKVEIRRRKPQH
jgi:hypothetical protein